MNLKQVREFKEMYVEFLRSSNVNLGRETKNKEAFVARAMQLVMDFVLAEADKTETDAPASTQKQDRIVSHQTPEALANMVTKGVSSMTASQSRKADEELGRAPNFDT